jgi:hypothetical protein
MLTMAAPSGTDGIPAAVTDGGGAANVRRASSRRSVLKRSLRSGPLEARRTTFSVASAIFWRMRGEVRQPDL